MFDLTEGHGATDVDLVEVEPFGGGLDDVYLLGVEGQSLESEGVDQYVVATPVVGKVGIFRIEGDAVGADELDVLAGGAVAEEDILVDGETLVV